MGAGPSESPNPEGVCTGRGLRWEGSALAGRTRRLAGRCAGVCGAVYAKSMLPAFAGDTQGAGMGPALLAASVMDDYANC